ncbi:MAG: TA system VapC family ribonuclease toxin [Thermodesulfobacteriota bacterium]|nr:TA system VapC family ribonuclease toxin [Thermodesulfobacteriota bacterium]
MDRELFCLTWVTLMSYLRMSTHPRIFLNPLSPSEAFNNVEALLALPQVRVISEMEGFLEVYRDVTDRFPVRGNLVLDAHLAAVLRQNEIKKLFTTDSDFMKFDFLDVPDPFV